MNEPPTTSDFVVFRRDAIEEALRGCAGLQGGDCWTILKSGLDGNDPSAQALYQQIREELEKERNQQIHASVSWTYIGGDRADESLLHIRKDLKTMAGWWNDGEEAEYQKALRAALGED